MGHILMSGASILMLMQWFKALCPNLLLRLVFISFSWENPLSASELDGDMVRIRSLKEGINK